VILGKSTGLRTGLIRLSADETPRLSGADRTPLRWTRTALGELVAAF
jgi:uncharacterized membrane protein YidH (DUF202 family)